MNYTYYKNSEMHINEMRDDEKKQYYKKCNLLVKLILKQYHPRTINKNVNEDNGFIEVFISKSHLTLLPNKTWIDTKRVIDKLLRDEYKVNSGDCNICSKPININVSCPECGNKYCSDCYIKIFKKGKGIITCPYCKFKYGNVMSDLEINYGILEIRRKLNLRRQSNYYNKNKTKMNSMCRDNYKNKRDIHLQKAKDRYQEKKEEIKKKQNEKFNCECGGRYSNSTKARHLRTKRHMKYIDKIFNEAGLEVKESF